MSQRRAGGRTDRMARAAVLALAAGWMGGCDRDEAGRPAPPPPPSPPSRISHGSGGEVIIALQRDTVALAGLETSAPAAATLQPERAAYGRVLDPEPLVALNAELTAAASAASASKAEAFRLEGLQRDGGAASVRAVEAAKAQADADAARLAAAQQRLTLELGALAEADSARRREGIARLSGLKSLLVRVDLPAGESIDPAPAGARLAVVGFEDRPLAANAVAIAPRADPVAPGQGLLLRVDDAPAGARPGAAVTAWLALPGDPLKGVVVPRSAVVRFGGKAWAYVELEGAAAGARSGEPAGGKGASKEKGGDKNDGGDKGKDAEKIGGEKPPAKTDKADEVRYVRREVDLGHPVAAGWFVAAGFAAGDRVVTTGAQTLLSEELFARTRPEPEEAGEEKE